MKKLFFSTIAVVGVVGTALAFSNKSSVGALYVCSPNVVEPGACEFSNILVGFVAITYIGGTPFFCTNNTITGDCTVPKTLVLQP